MSISLVVCFKPNVIGECLCINNSALGCFIFCSRDSAFSGSSSLPMIPVLDLCIVTELLQLICSSFLSHLSKPNAPPPQSCWDFTLVINLVSRTQVGGRSWEGQVLFCNSPIYLKHLCMLQAKLSSSHENEWSISAGSEDSDIQGFKVLNGI